MHEQFHEQPAKIDGNGEPYKNLPGDTDALKQNATPENFIESIAAPMRRFALENSCGSHEDLDAAIQSGKFASMLRVGNTIGIGVLLTVSPSDEPLDELFWHCSMSIVSLSSFRPKSFALWTKTEKLRVKSLLSAFLGKAGLPETQVFLKTKTALHVNRELTTQEMMQIYKTEAI